MKDYVIRNEKWYPYMIKKHTLILIFVNCSQTQKSGLRKSRKPHIYYSLVRLAGVKQKNSLSTAFIAPRILSWGTYGAVQLNIMHKNKAYVVICPVSLTFISQLNTPPL